MDAGGVDDQNGEIMAIEARAKTSEENDIETDFEFKIEASASPLPPRHTFGQRASGGGFDDAHTSVMPNEETATQDRKRDREHAMFSPAGLGLNAAATKHRRCSIATVESAWHLFVSYCCE